jgi:hypothetical protein
MYNSRETLDTRNNLAKCYMRIVSGAKFGPKAAGNLNFAFWCLILDFIYEFRFNRMEQLCRTAFLKYQMPTR